MRYKRSASWAAGVLVAVVSLAGCASPVLNTLPKKSSASSAVTTTSAASACTPDGSFISACVRLGDLTTLDPCSLITAGQLPPDLAAKPSDRDSLDHCDFTITAGSEKNVTLEIGQLESADGSSEGGYTAGSQQLQATGLDLRKGALNNGECDDAVEFLGDDVDLDVVSFVFNGAGSQSMCDAVNEVGTALGAVIASKAPVQHFTVPKNSIARVQSCELINGTQIGANTLDAQVDSPSDHSCEWTEADGDSVDQYGIELEIGTKLDPSDTDGQVQVHGLQTIVSKNSDSSSSRCELDTYRAPWGGGAGGLVETAAVWAFLGPGQTDAACSQATQLANVAWPKLPPIS